VESLHVCTFEIENDMLELVLYCIVYTFYI